MGEKAVAVTALEKSDALFTFVGQSTGDEKLCCITRKKTMVFEVITQGRCEYLVNGRKLEAKKNDLVFIGKGCTYTCTPISCRKIWIEFGGEFFEYCVRTFLPGEFCVFERCDFTVLFEKAAKTIGGESASGDLLNEKISMILMKIFFFSGRKMSKKRQDLAEVIKQHIDDNIERKFSLNDLCIQLNYSKNYIIQIFSKKYEMTPYKYYLKSKMDLAKIYLRESSFSVCEISDRMNFADQQYFSTLFKNIVGCSPNEYRKGIWKKEEV